MFADFDVLTTMNGRCMAEEGRAGAPSAAPAPPAANASAACDCSLRFSKFLNAICCKILCFGTTAFWHNSKEANRIADGDKTEERKERNGPRQLGAGRERVGRERKGRGEQGVDRQDKWLHSWYRLLFAKDESQAQH